MSAGEIDVARTMALRSIEVTQSRAITVDQGISNGGTDSKLPLSPYSPRSAAPFTQGLMLSTKTLMGKPPLSAETIALARLSNDLMMATPLVLASCFILPCLAFLGWMVDSNSWAMKELRTNGLVYAELLITVPLLLFFVYNHLRNPSRYGSGDAEVRTIGGRIAPPGFEFRIATQQDRNNREMDRAEMVDRIYLPRAEHGIELAEPAKARLADEAEKDAELWK